MPSTDKLPTGQWRSRVYIGNGKSKSFYAKTKKEAEQKSYEYLVQNPATPTKTRKSTDFPYFFCLPMPNLA